ncbi:MAG TPA: SxtJ family membrane protein [Thermoanaerobaculia bacterium]|nr:SxtJ family membrane protein [Thermoanaerobaculia bacterium]
MIRIERHPSPAQLRLFGAVLFPLFCGLVGAILLFRFGLEDAAPPVWGLGAASLALALVRPALVRPIYLGLMLATYPIGWVVSHLILVLVYYGVVTPVGLVLRLAGRDPLLKRPDPARASYWREREPARDVKRYFRQF